jgi:hypothetical protein
MMSQNHRSPVLKHMPTGTTLDSGKQSLDCVNAIQMTFAQIKIYVRPPIQAAFNPSLDSQHVQVPLRTSTTPSPAFSDLKCRYLGVDMANKGTASSG